MAFREDLEGMKEWTVKEQVELCDVISFNITICVRAIISEEENTNSEKVEAIKWLNEFHHRIIGLKSRVEGTEDLTILKKGIKANAKNYSSKNGLTKNAIANALRPSFKVIKNKKS